MDHTLGDVPQPPQDQFATFYWEHEVQPGFKMVTRLDVARHGLYSDQCNQIMVEEVVQLFIAFLNAAPAVNLGGHFICFPDDVRRSDSVFVRQEGQASPIDDAASTIVISQPQKSDPPSILLPAGVTDPRMLNAPWGGTHRA